MMSMRQVIRGVADDTAHECRMRCGWLWFARALLTGELAGRIVLLLPPLQKKERRKVAGNSNQDDLQVWQYSLSVYEKELIWVNVFRTCVLYSDKDSDDGKTQGLPQLSSSIHEIQHSFGCAKRMPAHTKVTVYITVYQNCYVGVLAGILVQT